MKKHLLSFTSVCAILLWVALTGLRLLEAWQETRLIPALLAAQSGLIVWLVVSRRSHIIEERFWKKLLAWFSALLPLAMRVDRETLIGQVITGLGLLLVLWAMGTLGRSFGIAPADRGLVKEGPYRFVRHPMYLGELIALSGAVIGNPSTWNVILIHVLLLALLLRIRWEERALFNYGAYAGRVRWRLIPHIF
jgi:protein-S-isoprenylcysteine O-methyltransferase Ste14